MSYIRPSTNIRILKNCPLDNTYEHTIYFATLEAQADYFISLTKYNLTDYTYQRLQRGKMSVGYNADDLYDCNYLMYKNTGFGNKWFYAFITAVEYVNNNVSTIEFEIDPIQTWYMDHVNFPSITTFVERQHVPVHLDTIGGNLEPEPIAIGEYVFNDYGRISFNTGGAIIVAVVDTESSAVSGHINDNVYSGATLYAYRDYDVTGVNTLLTQYLESPDSVIQMYMCPAIIVPGTISTSSDPNDHKLSVTTATTVTNINTIQPVTTSDRLDEYEPINHKLYSYPFNYYHVDNANGDDLTLRYEYFENYTPKFIEYGSITTPVQVVLEPYDYKNVKLATGESITPNRALHTEKLVLSSYPLCSWNTDAYKAWVAQNALPIGMNLGGKLIASTDMSSRQYRTFDRRGIYGVTDLLSETWSASIKNDISKGSYNSGNVNFAHNTQEFYGGRASIDRVNASMIDSYFQKYGYARNKIEYVDVTSRPYWNFVKTIDCTITASIPADDANKICDIFDNGITFWKKPNMIGDYNHHNKVEGD